MAADPRLVDAAAHFQSGRHREAALGCEAVLARSPDNVEALHLLGLIRHVQGDNASAVALLNSAVARAPETAELRSNFAAVLRSLGRCREALDHAAAAVRLDPRSAKAHNNHGVALEEFDRVAESVAAYRRAVALRPAYAEAHNNLGNALRKLGRLEDAVQQHHEAIRLSPAYGPAYNNLARSLAELGLPDEALSMHRKHAELAPSSPAAHSAMLVAMQYPWHGGRQVRFDEHLRWAARFAPREVPPGVGHDPVEPRPDRRLRIGYVSPDFRDHPAARLMVGVIGSLDRERAAVTCYSDTVRADALTEAIRAAADVWRDTMRLSDSRLCDLVRQDRIDVLVDLTGHMAGHRLLAFARRPAPVQVTQFGYPDTTGLAAIGWRVTDTYADPPSATERFHTERLTRLPHCAWCYDPGPYTVPVAEPPAAKVGRVTFGCLNNPAKVTAEMIEIWSEIIRRVPGSRMLLLSAAGEAGSRHVRERFARHGVCGDAVRFVGNRPRQEYLRWFDRIDVSLDPAPYNGGVTSCDSLWMGVPVVTLAGDGYRSRQGLMLLSNVGLEGFVGATTQSYVDVAVRAASDVDALVKLRRELRDRLAASPVMDAAGYASALQAAYESMWRTLLGAGCAETPSR